MMHFKEIDDVLKEMQAPKSRYKHFHILNLDDMNHDDEPDVFGPYQNDFFEISFGIGDEITLSVDDKSKRLKSGHLVFASPGQTLTWQMHPSSEKEKPAVYILLIKPEFVGDQESMQTFFQNYPFFNKYTMPTYQLNKSQEQEFRAIYHEIYLEYKLAASDSLAMIKVLFDLFLLKAKRELQASANIEFRKSRAEEITFKFENLIQIQDLKRQSIDFYAEQLNISAVYLSECIKKVTTKSAKQIIDYYIVLDAKTRLRQSSQSISEIAYTLGFSEVTNFVKFFKRQTKLTPKAFRQKHSY
jgi:AraC-like DNA-binding protein